LKKAVIAKVMPDIRTTTLKSDEAIDDLFNQATSISKKKVGDWKADMINLAEAATKAVDSEDLSPVETARAKRLAHLNKGNK